MLCANTNALVVHDGQLGGCGDSILSLALEKKCNV
jgi:hypothetical protein